MALAASAGLTEDEFWLCTPRYLAAVSLALVERDRGDWERSRYIAFHMIKTVDSKGKYKRITDIGKFPWEEEKRKKFAPMTPEELEELKRFEAETDKIIAQFNNDR